MIVFAYDFFDYVYVYKKSKKKTVIQNL